VEAFDSKIPAVIIGRTVMGKGVSFMEGDVSYHGKPLDMEKAASALAELGLESDIERYVEMRKELPSYHEHVRPIDEVVRPVTGDSIVYPVDKKTDNRSALEGLSQILES
jgi:transketolase